MGGWCSVRTYSAIGLHLHIVPSPNITKGQPCCSNSSCPSETERKGEGEKQIKLCEMLGEDVM